jgi:hypothetical protein
MADRETFSVEEAHRIGEETGIEWSSPRSMPNGSEWAWMSSWNLVSATY